MTDKDKKKNKSTAIEVSLRKIEAERKALLDAIPDLMFLFNQEGQFVDYKASNHGNLLLGPEEFLGTHISETLPPDLAETTLARLAELFKSGKTQVYEYLLEIAGEQKMFESRLVPCGEDRALAIVRDITERRQIEEALRQSEEQFRSLNENISIGIYRSTPGPEGRFLVANPAFMQIFGIKSKEELTQVKVSELYQEPADRYEFSERLIANGQLKGVELPLKRIDGTPIWGSITAQVIHTEQGEVAWFDCTIEDITERKEAEEELILQRERLANIVEGADVGTWEWNVQTGETIFNEKWAEIIGYTLEELSPVSIETWIKHTHPDDLEASDRMLEQHFRGELDSYNIECRMRHRNGHWVWINDRGKVVSWTEDGKPLWVFGTHIDITERKQAEKELEESRNLLRSMFQSIQDGISILNTDFTIREVNHTIEKWYSQAAPFTGKKCYEVYQNRSEPCVACPSIEALKKKTVCFETVPLMKDDKQVGWVELYSHPMIDKTTGAVNGIVEFARDITDRKQAEEDLKASEQRYREILSTMEEGYYEVDLNGNFVFFNESLYRQSGYSSEELMGESYKRFYKNPDEVFKTYNRVYRTGKPETGVDWPVITSDGRIIYVEVSISLHRDEKGEPIGFRGVARDITQRRQAEERIRHLSFHDQLTGLYNRHFLEVEMERLNTERQLPISIIMADLNGLKLVNDTYGHHAGDEMLKRVAAILKSVCREDDLIARFGGDEFVLYLPRTEENEALKISSRIEESCRKEQVNIMPVSLSSGVAVKISAEQELPDVLREAEDNMYQNKLTESRSGKSAIVNTLLKTLAEKSFETEAHTRNMQEAAIKIGEKLGLPNSELHRLHLLITLHDIGKINLPEHLLTKMGALENEELEVLKKHCEIGYRIARASGDFAHVAEDILAHHERWDGSGYPQGLKGEDIPLLARIAALVDAYEVMINGRPYKKAMQLEAIKAELKKSAGTHFDPKLVEIFLLILEAEG